MAIYGFFISAPLNHTLVGQLQKAFSGKEGFKYKVAQLAANSLLVSPVTVSGELRLSRHFVLCITDLHCHFLSLSLSPSLPLSIVYLASMAIINGAKSVDEIIKTIKAGFFSVIRVCVLLRPFNLLRFSAANIDLFTCRSLGLYPPFQCSSPRNMFLWRYDP